MNLTKVKWVQEHLKWILEFMASNKKYFEYLKNRSLLGFFYRKILIKS